MHDQSFLAKVLDGRLPRAPIMDLLEWRFIDFDEANSALSVEMQAKPEFVNPAGFIHGGMLAAMLDETVAPTAAAGLGPDEFAVTLEIKVTFVSPAKVGKVLGTGRVVNRGQSICFLEAQLHNADGILLATASATSKISRTVKPRADT